MRRSVRNVRQMCVDSDQRGLPSPLKLDAGNAEGCMKRVTSPVSTRLGLPGNPCAAEEIMIARDLRLARLTGERARTVNQIKLFAEVIREGSWVDARIDMPQPDRKPMAKAR